MKKAGSSQPRAQGNESQAETAASPGPSSSGATLAPSGPSNRRGSMDTRSLRAPSMHHLSAPSGMSPSSSMATSGITALSASPSSGSYGGGAAARLKRVASNASIASTFSRLAGADKATSNAPAAGVLDQGGDAEMSPGVTLDNQGSSAPANSKAASSSTLDMPQRRGRGGSARKQQAGLSQAPSDTQSMSPVVDEDRPLSADDAGAETGQKRQSPPSHLRPESASRGAARRRTWYGWNASPAQEQEDEPVSVSPDDQRQQKSALVEESAPHPMDTSQQPSQAADHNAKEPDGPEQSPHHPSGDTPTLRVPLSTAANRAARTSWFGWRGVSAPAAQPITPHTSQAQPEQTPKGSITSVSKAPEDSVDSATSEQTVKPNPRPDAEATQQQVGASSIQPISPTEQTPQAPSAGQSSWAWKLWSSPAPANQPSQNTVDGKDVAEIAPTTSVEPGTSDGHGPTASPPSPNHVASRPDGAGSPSVPILEWSRWLPFWNQPPTAATVEADQAQPTQNTPEEQPPLTPAEQVKADALARPDSVASQRLAVNASQAILNSSTRGSWISYFSNRNARPVGQIASQDPEVMEVDFEEGDGASSTAPPPPLPPLQKSKDSRSTVANEMGPPPAAQRDDGRKENNLKAPPADVPSSAKPSRPSTPALGALDAPKPDPASPTSRPATPLTSNKGKGSEVAKKANKKAASNRPSVPNLVLPTYEDTFLQPPRSLSPPAGVLKRTLTAVNTWLSGPSDASRLRTAPRTRKDGSASGSIGLALAEEAAVRLPRAWETMGHRARAEKKGCDAKIRRIVVFGIHGWFAQSWASKWMGEPTGTSTKFVTEMRDAVLRHVKSVEGMELNPEAVTMIPLYADGTVSARVDRSYAALLSRKEWVQHLREADAIFFACHSQGCIVGTNLLARMIEQELVQPRRTRMAVLAMCGVHAGPFEHIRTTVVSSYLNYFETTAAKELFEFQHSSSAVSKQYEHSLKVVLDAGAKLTLVASTDDQVVPLHSALFTSATHPSILRALYIHGATFPKLDFLTNMLTFCVAVRNAGLSDHNLLALLSASVAGSLYGGLGHSLCYDEHKTYDLAVQYLFQATHPLSEPTTRAEETRPPTLQLEPFETRKLNNPHLLPWSLRGILEDAAVRATFAREINKLLNDFETWRPATKTLKDVQYRLEPMRSVPRPPVEESEALLRQHGSATDKTSPTPSSSKL